MTLEMKLQHANPHVVPGNGHHEYKNGVYVAKEYEHQEYPKSLYIDGAEVVVNSAEEEAAALDK